MLYFAMSEKMVIKCRVRPALYMTDKHRCARRIIDMLRELGVEDEKLGRLEEELRDAWRREDDFELESVLGELVELAERYGIEVRLGDC